MNSRNSKGFTLIEAIIYIGIVSILLVAVTDFHFSLGGTASKLSANIDTSRNRRMVLSGIDYLIRNADGLLKDIKGDCSNFSGLPQKLSLYFEDDTYLPDTCVTSDGGGLNITISSDRVVLQCLPNITYNGEYEACDTSAGNSYYLSSPTVKVSNKNLSFSTSTVEGFDNITTNLIVNSIATEQKHLTASSLATSTISLRNEQNNGLIAWWKMDESGNSIASLIDSIGNHTASCSGDINSSTGLIDGSTSSNHITSSTDYCQVTDNDDLNFNDGFTLSAWLKRDSSSTDRKEIINKYTTSTNSGYAMYIYNNALICVVCDSTDPCASSIWSLPSWTSTKANFIACTYDKNIGKIFAYTYEEGDEDGEKNTGTTMDTFLVNADKDLFIGNDSTDVAYYFDGDLDELRIYNRALTDNEIYALETQGSDYGGCPEC